MKTLTEFAVATLKNASQTQQSLVTAGKTPEELPAALGEALKLEGDKLTFVLAALEVVGTKLADLKRVVVFQLAENEKAPTGAIQKGDHYYSVDYYPPIHKQGSAPAAASDSRGGKPGDKNRGGKRGGGRDGDRRNDRGAGGPGGGPKGSREPRTNTQSATSGKPPIVVTVKTSV